ncbi:MAG: addiction module protein [Gemmatimonadaceae bacterium]
MQPLSEAQIRAMTVEERLHLIETVWDSLEPAELPLSDDERAELDRRLDQPAPGPAIPWDQVRAELEHE